MRVFLIKIKYGDQFQMQKVETLRKKRFPDYVSIHLSYQPCMYIYMWNIMYVIMNSIIVICTHAHSCLYNIFVHPAVRTKNCTAVNTYKQQASQNILLIFLLGRQLAIFCKISTLNLNFKKMFLKGLCIAKMKIYIFSSRSKKFNETSALFFANCS